MIRIYEFTLKYFDSLPGLAGGFVVAKQSTGLRWGIEKLFYREAAKARLRGDSVKLCLRSRRIWSEHGWRDHKRINLKDGEPI